MKMTWAEFVRYVEDLGVTASTRINSIDVTEPDHTEQGGKELHVNILKDQSVDIISL